MVKLLLNVVGVGSTKATSLGNMWNTKPHGMTINLFEKHSATDLHCKTRWNGTFPKHAKNEKHIFKKGKGLGSSVERVLLEFGAGIALMKLMFFDSFEAGRGMEQNDFCYLTQ